MWQPPAWSATGSIWRSIRAKRKPGKSIPNHLVSFEPGPAFRHHRRGAAAGDMPMPWIGVRSNGAAQERTGAPVIVADRSASAPRLDKAQKPEDEEASISRPVRPRLYSFTRGFLKSPRPAPSATPRAPRVVASCVVRQRRASRPYGTIGRYSRRARDGPTAPTYLFRDTAWEGGRGAACPIRASDIAIIGRLPVTPQGHEAEAIKAAGDHRRTDRAQRGPHIRIPPRYSRLIAALSMLRAGREA